jgi:hypothetical protein
MNSATASQLPMPCMNKPSSSMTSLKSHQPWFTIVNDYPLIARPAFIKDWCMMLFNHAVFVPSFVASKFFALTKAIGANVYA